MWTLRGRWSSAAPDVTARSDSGFTPLMFAARSGDLELTRLLLDSGADVNTSAADGSTALLVATVRGHLALAGVPAGAGRRPERGRGRVYTPPLGLEYVGKHHDPRLPRRVR